MSVAFELKLALARTASRLTRLRGGGGTSLPGKLLVRLDPEAIGKLAGRLPDGNVVISATNGKTTTAAMVAGVLDAAGISVVHNQAGANMAGGVASTLLSAAHPRAGISGKLGLFEIDEFWLDRLVPELRPKAILLCNLFRDQLDRYGELDAIAERWREVLRSSPGATAQLVCNADDPLVADLGEEREETVYFGIEDDSLALEQVAHASDAKHCRNCGAPYTFDSVYLGHLGRYHCPACGRRRPSPTVLADAVELDGVRRSRLRLRTPAGSARLTLPLPGLYNVYNALAAAAVCTTLGIPIETIVAGLEGFSAAFGRAETVRVAGRETRILLVKNPVGTNEVLRTLVLEPGEHDLLGILNDRVADGRDVSWIWDADFELLAGRVGRFTCAGTRAAELALRLKYGGVASERIRVIDSLTSALRSATTSASREDCGRMHEQTPLYVLPTYTAMLELREELVRRGEAVSSWL